MMHWQASSEPRTQALQRNSEQSIRTTPIRRILQQATDDSQDQEDVVTYLTDEDVESAGMSVSSQFCLLPTVLSTRSPSRIASRQEQQPSQLQIIRSSTITTGELNAATEVEISHISAVVNADLPDESDEAQDITLLQAWQSGRFSFYGLSASKS